MKTANEIMKKILPLMVVCAMLASCAKFHYSEIKSDNVGVWNSFEPKVFEFDWKKPEMCVDLSITVGVDTAVYRDDAMPLIVKLASPDGESRQFQTQVIVRDRDGVLHGEADENGHIVCTEIVRPHMFFNTKGVHRIEIKQGTSKYDLPGVHTVGISIDKSNLEYKN